MKAIENHNYLSINLRKENYEFTPSPTDSAIEAIKKINLMRDELYSEIDFSLSKTHIIKAVVGEIQKKYQGLFCLDEDCNGGSYQDALLPILEFFNSNPVICAETCLSALTFVAKTLPDCNNQEKIGRTFTKSIGS